MVKKDRSAAWNRVKAVFQQALEHPPEERRKFLERACGDDEALHAEVLSLLSALEQSRVVLDSSPGWSVAETESMPELPETIGPYKVVRRIGRGGMGSVFEAVRQDGEFRRRVAIKLIRPEVATPALLERFRRERQILADLDHPGVATLLDGGTTDEGLPYLIMEYVEGRPIDEHCDALAMTVEERVELFVAVCEAVQAAHEREIVHRDLKPGNVMVSEDGHPKLLDFGIAKLLDPHGAEEAAAVTRHGERLMTTAYASPEQFRGQPVTPASDVYSLGVILYGLLTGHPPYAVDGLSLSDSERTVCEMPVEKPSTAIRGSRLPTRDTGRKRTLNRSAAAARDTEPKALAAVLDGALDAIVMRTLAKQPDDRYSHAGELCADLKAWLGGGRVDATSRRLSAAPATVERRRALLRNATAAASIAAITLLLSWGVLAPDDNAEELRAGTQVPLVTWASNESDGQVSADQRWISFVSDRTGTRSIWIKPIHGDEPRELMTTPDLLSHHLWSPDSASIAYLALVDSRLSLRIRPTDGGAGSRFALPGHRVKTVHWSDRGIYLLIEGAIHLLDPTTGKRTRITRSDEDLFYVDADIDREEARIVFTAEEDDGRNDLWVASIDGTGRRRLTENDLVESNPRWLPAGPGGFLYLSNEGGRVDPWWHRPDGIPRRLMTTRERERSFEISPDGSLVVIDTTDEDGDLWRLSVDGSERQLTIDEAVDYLPSAPAVDGSIVFQRPAPGADERFGPFETDLWLLPGGAADRTPTRVARNGFAPTLSPDAEWLAYRRVLPTRPTISELHLARLDTTGGHGADAPDRNDDSGPGTPVLRGDTVLSTTVRSSSLVAFPTEWIYNATSWDPSSARLFFTDLDAAGGDSVRRVELSGKEPVVETLAIAPEGMLIREISLSPKGRSLAVLLEAPGAEAPWSLQMADADAPALAAGHTATGTRLRPLGTPIADRVGIIGWLDDRRIAVTAATRDRRQLPSSRVLTIRTDGVTREVLTIGDSWPYTAALDAARRMLYITRAPADIGNIWAVSLETGTRRQLTENRLPSVSFAGIHPTADGLIYARQQRNQNVWLVELGPPAQPESGQR